MNFYENHRPNIIDYMLYKYNIILSMPYYNSPYVCNENIFFYSNVSS